MAVTLPKKPVTPTLPKTPAVGATTSTTPAVKPAGANYGGSGNPLNEILYSKKEYDKGNEVWAKNNATKHYGALDPNESALVKGMSAQQLGEYIVSKQSTKTAAPAATPTPSAPAGFQAPGYTALDYATALSRSNNQLDPTYKRAAEGVMAQRYQDTLDTGQIASNMGGAHSGLAADAQNKVHIAAAGKVADLDAQRASQAAEMAQALVNRSEDRGDQLRRDAFAEYMGEGQLGLSRDQFNWNKSTDQRDFDYGKGRDAVQDSQWDKSFNYNAGRDKVADSQWNQQFEYGKGRDAVGDSQWNQEFGYGKTRDERADFESDRQFNQDVKEFGLQYALEKNAQAMQASREARIASGGGGGSSGGGSSGSSYKATAGELEDIQKSMLQTYGLRDEKGNYRNPTSPIAQSKLIQDIMAMNLSSAQTEGMLRRFGLSTDKASKILDDAVGRQTGPLQ